MAEVAFVIPGNIDAPTGGYAYDRRVMALLPSFGVRLSHVELPGSFPAPTAADLAETERRLAGTPADAVLLFDGLAYGAMPVDIVERLGRRVVALVHHPLCLETGLAADRAAALKASEHAALARAKRVVATSAATARILESDFAVPAALVTVAEPGTDPAGRATGTGSPMQLLALGAVSPRKGYDVLVDALAPLAHLDWRLAIVGALDRDAATAEALAGRIAERGLGERVTLAGAVSPAHLAHLFESTDVFVSPSHYEGYGMGVAEALVRGLPIVCTTGAPVAAETGDGGMLTVPPGDAKALGAAIERVITERRLRNRLADASWEAGRRLPTWHETTRRVFLALQEAGA